MKFVSVAIGAGPAALGEQKCKQSVIFFSTETVTFISLGGKK